MHMHTQQLKINQNHKISISRDTKQQVYVNAGNGIRERNHNMHSSSAFATGIEWEENSPSSRIRIPRVNERIVVVQKWKSRHLLFGSWLVFNLLLPRFISFSPSSALSWPSAPAYIVCSKLRHISRSLFLSTDTHGKETGEDLSYYSRQTGAVLVSALALHLRIAPRALTHKLFPRMFGRRPLVPNTTNWFRS